MFHFAHDDSGVLRAEELPLPALADAVGTPTYVYSSATIERHYKVFDEAFAGHPHQVCYSVKANSSGAILSTLARLGAGADIVSGGELVRAQQAGIPADRIVFSGVGKTAAEMAAALDAKIRAFNVESEPELMLLNEVALARGAVAPVSLRVNPDVDAKTHPYIATGLKNSKFGVPITDAARISRAMKAMPGVSLHGIDCHIGSQLTSMKPILEALDSVLALVDALRTQGHPIHDVDLGGGIGIAYNNETPPHPAEVGRAVVERMKGRPEALILEPGRVIVGNAGILLTRVLYVKTTPHKTFVIVDAAMNDLIRPALYQAHHEIWPVTQRPGAQPATVDLVGPVCESGDAFAKDRTIPLPEPGDLLAILSAGAYGFVMASTYNSRPLAAEVLVKGDRWHLARRRQRIEEIMALESQPPWLDAKE
ncbi:MAG: diaminopimelate decarboxylase [Myxococcota bacterium]